MLNLEGTCIKPLPLCSKKNSGSLWLSIARLIYSNTIHPLCPDVDIHDMLESPKTSNRGTTDSSELIGTVIHLVDDLRPA